MLIFAAIGISLIVILLSIADIGFLYFYKREYQKAADLAAMAGAKQLQGGCAAYAKPAAIASADQNLGARVHTTTADCGRWDPTLNPTFATPAPSATTQNAVRVTISGAPPSFLMRALTPADQRVVSATAIAALKDPVAAFSVGSGVARLDGGALNQLLSTLLGTSVSLSLLDYTGLLNANVNLLGLTDALSLSIGTYDDLATAKVSLGALLNAAVNVLPQQNQDPTLSVAVSALNNLLHLPLSLNLNNLDLNLLSTPSQDGLLSVGVHTKDPGAALNANVSVLDLLVVGLQVATKDAAIAGAINLNLGVLGQVALKTTIIEPPSIAVGPPGYYADGTAKTAAHTGVLRLLLDTKVLTPVGNDGTLVDIPLLLKLSMPAGQLVSLPIYAEVAPGEANLETLQCGLANDLRHAQIGVQPGLAHVFVGQIPGAFTNKSTLWKDLVKSRFNLLSLKLEIPLLSITVPINLMAKMELSIPNGPIAKGYKDFTYDPNVPASQQNLTATVGTAQNLGAAIGSAINAGLLDVQLDTSGLSVLDIQLDLLSNIIDALVNVLVGVVQTVLSLVNVVLMPVLSLVDSIVGPLLKALGLQLGYADVQLLSVNCDYGAALVE